MNILALDTSMGACSAAILRAGDTGRRCHSAYVEMPRGHAEALMPMIEQVLGEAGIAPRDLDMIAATVGPGSFTGVRIAIAAARGLALATGASLLGVDSLTVMARAARQESLGPAAPFAVAVDGRRGMLYLGLFDETGASCEGPLLIAPDKAASILPPDTTLAVGSGAAMLAEAGALHGRAIAPACPALQPQAAALAEIAFESSETCTVLRPLYLRPPDAKPQAPVLEHR